MPYIRVYTFKKYRCHTQAIFFCFWPPSGTPCELYCFEFFNPRPPNPFDMYACKGYREQFWSNWLKLVGFASLFQTSISFASLNDQWSVNCQMTYGKFKVNQSFTFSRAWKQIDAGQLFLIITGPFMRLFLTHFSWISWSLPFLTCRAWRQSKNLATMTNWLFYLR